MNKLNFKATVANQSEVMDSDTISKKRASAKSLTSIVNFSNHLVLNL